MGRITKRDVVVGLLIAIASGVLFASPALDVARGVSLDILTALRWHVLGARTDPAASPTVVVAIDEESYRTPPFKGSPIVTWTREIGRVLTAVVDGGAKVVGFDIVFPNSIEQSEMPFGDEILGSRVRGFDRDFLRALAGTAARGKLVLGEIEQRDDPIRPSQAQKIAVRDPRNVRALNVHVDLDGVVRRLPLSFQSNGKPTASMATELAARALGAEPLFSSDGALTLGDRHFAGDPPNSLTLNFSGGPDDIPTYSLADLRACVDKGEQDFFKRQFAGKVVLFGTVLNIEDRKVTSKRWATRHAATQIERCELPAPTPGRGFKRSTIAGVYVHATGINNLLDADPVIESGRTERTLIGVGFAGLVAIVGLIFGPAWAALGYLSMAAALIGGATAVFTGSVALPLSEPILAGLVTLALIIGYRFIAVDRTERLLRTSFGLYLAPQVIDQMVTAQSLPRLGGEMRNVTVFFSDLVGFSSIAEQLTPEALVELMNEYLSEMTDIIEQCGGYVDKYIGDSIVAVFGAPAYDENHAIHAVRAALLCRDRLELLNQTSAAFCGHKLGHRIGLNSGEALVGNIGSRRRFNYTVMSDAVNLASRLEGANKYFGTSIMASEMTVHQTNTAFDWRELDSIRVQGRVQPVRIYQPLAEAGQTPQRQAEIASIYEQGLVRWRARDFHGAAASFQQIADLDSTAALFLERAKAFELHPPPEDWQPVHPLGGK